MFNGVNLDSFQVITNFKESVISHCYLDTMIKTKWFEEIPIVLKYKHHFKNTIGSYCEFDAKRNAKHDMKLIYNIRTDCCSIYRKFTNFVYISIAFSVFKTSPLLCLYDDPRGLLSLKTKCFATNIIMPPQKTASMLLLKKVYIYTRPL